jgi:hypothetical protein
MVSRGTLSAHKEWHVSTGGSVVRLTYVGRYHPRQEINTAWIEIEEWHELVAQVAADARAALRASADRMTTRRRATFWLGAEAEEMALT